MSYSSAIEPLRAGNLLSGANLFEISYFSAKGNRIKSSSGAEIVTRCYDEALGLDFLFLVAGGDPFKVDNPELFEWLAEAPKTDTVLGGISGGPVILTKAG
ncbi:MAG: GlxA family transcriptional regulator, partial [Paracoccaceae bacterium]|nr:GlxA family transcriptional regulator [Paracoccaceae bacterium]